MAYGSITQRGDKYRVCFDYGVDREGKRVRKYRTFDTKRDAIRAFNEHKVKMDRGRRSCRANTRSRSGLTTGTIILSCHRSSKRRHTVIKHHNLLTNTLNAAERQEYITKNPMRAVSPPKKRQREAKFYTPEQLGVLLAKAVGTRLELPMFICAYLGLRRGELCGLRWSDVDLEHHTITIENTRTQAGKKEIEKGTKTASSTRTLYLPDTLCDMLKAAKEHQQACRATYKNTVIVMEDGRPFRPNYLSELFGKFLADNDLPKIVLHELRHPYVKHTTKIFSLRLMDFQAQAYPDARRKTRGACQLHRGGQSRSPVRPLCNRKQFSCLLPQSKMSWILYAISMRLSGYTSTRSISSSASSVVSVSASKIALDASLRLSCRACSSCFCFACANTAA